MKEAKVVRLVQPGEFEDALTAVLRAGARDLLAQAIEAEVEDFRSRYADQRLKDGRERLVRREPQFTPDERHERTSAFGWFRAAWADSPLLGCSAASPSFLSRVRRRPR